VKIDCEKGEGIEIAKKFGIKGYPSYMMVDTDQQVTAGWIGYDGPASFAARVADGVADQRTIELKKASFDQEPTALLARTLAHNTALGYDFAGAATLLKQARDLDPVAGAADSGTILFFVFYAAQRGGATLDDFEAEAKIAAAAPDATASDHFDLAGMMASLASSKGEPKRASSYLKLAMAHSTEGMSEEDLASRERLEIPYALIVTGDTDKAIAMKKATYPEGWQDDAGKLNSFAWWCFENNINLEEAEKLALLGVELATTDRQRSSILDTAAEICNALGDCDQAVALMKKAIEMSPDSDSFKEQLARFEKVRDEAKQG
jgi:tetratricopeptide (TPR) repeat protein